MEPIADFSWMKDLLTGQVVERFPLGDYRAVALQLEGSDELRRSQYHYRLLIFPQRGNKPVLSLNLETSLLGAPCLTEQTGSAHQILADAEEEMAYETFRSWALERARAELHLA
jgi:hypothetical protein